MESGNKLTKIQSFKRYALCPHALCLILYHPEFRLPTSEFQYLSSVFCHLSSVICHLSSDMKLRDMDAESIKRIL